MFEMMSDKDQVEQLTKKIAALEYKFARLEGSRGAFSKEEQVTTTNSPSLEQFAEDVSSLVGLKETVESKHKTVKFLWAILFLLGIAATIYFLYSTAVEYLAEPTLTKVALESQPYYSFPPFVLCNDAWFDTAKALSTGLSMNAFKYSLGYWGYEGRLNLEPKDINSSRQEFLEFYQKSNYTSLIDYYKSIAVDLEPKESLESLYNSTKPSYLLETGRVPTTKRFVPLYAVCHEFKLPPVDGRLSFLFDPERIAIKYTDRTLGVLSKVTQNWFLHMAHDARSLFAWPIIIRNGKHIILTIRERYLIAVDKPAAPCYEPKKEERYVTPVCMANCFQNLLKDETGPCLALRKSTGDQPSQPAVYCNGFDSLGTTKGAQPNPNQLAQATAKAKETCLKKCPIKCNRTVYEAVLEGSDDVWDSYQPAIALASNDRSNLSVTTITVHHHAVTEGGILITRELNTYSFTEFVNNVGGTLGLFVGGTVMTFVQVIMHFVNYLFHRQTRVESVHPS